ncbi:16S rRNA (cytidine(1402)-2'-O)-methyltransferase [Roseicyclus sp. F158]|uniref:Ribosomal RNA small subunit methyltransferase I n=1 Tax=Tropicimonas omnivorans TaxID=3075590 RepID=A0ABU3DFF6_9RHOB|nr:16S rRNA (cytidine(1402)-2'-O)-methyltransferase [Roseicyclus sp. F158]MDT0682449.1 16S rRNA (cytidine(1402)-2'-O)-methyltransferase [Roseicyclus sp. F158]
MTDETDQTGFEASAGGTPARQVALAPGLYLVATPIGSARDITLRALDILASADTIAAEDTRTARHLMELHGIKARGRRIVAYHDHSSEGDRARLLGLVRDGGSVACVSEAGTPLVADPGYRLVKDAVAEGLPVTAAPGPSAALAALSVSGLPSDRFLFAGFPPSKGAERRKVLEELANIPSTLVLYESPRRIKGLLADLVDIAGADRKAAICRELTKRFEEVIRGTLAELAEAVPDKGLRGEVVLVLDRPLARPIDQEEVDAALLDALERLPMKAAASEIAMRFGTAKRDMYQLALRLKG